MHRFLVEPLDRQESRDLGDLSRKLFQDTCSSRICLCCTKWRLSEFAPYRQDIISDSISMSNRLFKALLGLYSWTPGFVAEWTHARGGRKVCWHQGGSDDGEKGSEP